MKKGFTLFNDSLGVLSELSDEQAGQLFKAIRDFNAGKEPELDSLLRIAFAPFKNQFVRNGIGKSTMEISKINTNNRKNRKSTKDNENNESNEINESVHYINSISNSNLIVQVISYLNEKTKANFSEKTTNTIKHISARINEGRTIEDFKKVIDIKILEWIGTEQAKYLRPDTLFGSKFESYLNQHLITKIEKQKPESAFDRYIKTLPNE